MLILGFDVITVVFRTSPLFPNFAIIIKTIAQQHYTHHCYVIDAVEDTTMGFAIRSIHFAVDIYSW